MSHKKNIRIIPRLDIKAPNLIKGVHLEGLRVLGDPAEFAYKYYIDGADELLYIDAVASLYERNSLLDIVKSVSDKIFIPMTVGGGIRKVEDVECLLEAGADKVAINTAAVRNPKLLRDLSRNFGSQCIVLYVEAKKTSDTSWEAYVDNGREKTGLDVLDWVKKAEDLGAGEILLTSVDNEGTQKGYDTNLIRSASEIVNIPIIASGGFGKNKDMIEAVKAGACAISVAHSLHYKKTTIQDIKKFADESKYAVRK